MPAFSDLAAAERLHSTLQQSLLGHGGRTRERGDGWMEGGGGERGGMCGPRAPTALCQQGAEGEEQKKYVGLNQRHVL